MTKARDFPLALSSLRTTVSLSSSKSSASNKLLRFLREISNTASTIHLVAPDRMVDKSARCPRIRESAFRSIDFPEPVSPVSIQRPEAK